MKAHIKRRQRNKTLTIVAALVIVGVSLVAGFYVALNIGNSPLDKFIGVSVSSSDEASLYQLSHAAFGPSGASMLTSSVLKTANGSPYVSAGKPIMVYIGG